MRHIILTAILLSSLKQVFSQKNDKTTFEAGLKAVSLTFPSQLYGLVADQPLIQYVNEVFFVVHKKKISFRSHISYSKNETRAHYKNIEQARNVPSGSVLNRDFQISSGLQRSVLKNKKLIYILADLYYRRINSNGKLHGGINSIHDSFEGKTNQIGLNAGIGFKLELFKSVYLSPELFYDINYSTTSITQTLVKGNVEKTSSYSSFTHRPAARLFLSFTF